MGRTTGSAILCDTSSPISHTSSFPPSHPGHSCYTRFPMAVSSSLFMPPLKRHLTAPSKPSRPPSQCCTSLAHSPQLLPLPTAPHFLKLSCLLAYVFMICLLPPASKILEDRDSVRLLLGSISASRIVPDTLRLKKNQCFCN